MKVVDPDKIYDVIHILTREASREALMILSGYTIVVYVSIAK